MGRQGMELWRPDWIKIYKGTHKRHTVMPDIEGELLTVTRESLRLALGCLETQIKEDAYDNYISAYKEIERVLK